LQHEAFGLSWPPYHLHSACCPVVGRGADGGLSPPHTDQQVPARRLLASRDRHVRRAGMVQSESRVDSAASASRHPAWVAGRTL